MSVHVFKGCESLDFSPNYAAKRQLTNEGLFWLREEYPMMVQFCKKRGRIYGCKACLSSKSKGCSDYAETTHEVEVPDEEIES